MYEELIFGPISLNWDWTEISAGFSAGFSARPKSLLNRHPGRRDAPPASLLSLFISYRDVALCGDDAPLPQALDKVALIPGAGADQTLDQPSALIAHWRPTHHYPMHSLISMAKRHSFTHHLKLILSRPRALTMTFIMVSLVHSVVLLLRHLAVPEKFIPTC